jgi:type I restriction enzyme S subunit
MKNWSQVSIGDVAEIIATGKTPSTKKGEYFGGEVSWFTPGDIGNSTYLGGSSRTITDSAIKEGAAPVFPKGSLLVTCIGNIGRVGILSQDSSSNQQITAIRFKDCIDVRYAYFWFVANSNALRQRANQAVVPILNNSQLREIRFTFPPLPIQKQIAAILEKADAARDKRRQANQLTEQFLQSAFLEMFGDPLKSSTVKKRVLVGDILESYQYGLSVALSGDSSPSDGLPILRIANITGQGYIDYSDLKYHRVGKKREETLLLRKGDLLFNWRNSPKWVGKTAIFNCEGDFIFASFLLRLRIKEELVNKVFFWYWVNYLRAKGVFQSKCRQAVNQASFNGFDLERIEMICPPLSDQQKFAALVEKVESLRAKQRESERELEELFNSLMQRAFRGELVRDPAG